MAEGWRSCEEVPMMARIDYWLLFVICATAFSCALLHTVSWYRLQSSKYSPFPVLSKLHQEMSLPTRTTAAPCSFCSPVLPVCRDSNIRTHGPVTSRCPGLGLPPFLTDTPSSSASIVSVPLPAHRLSISRVDPPAHSSVINPGWMTCSILKRIQSGSWASCSEKLASILDAIVKENDGESWNRLFLFSRRCLAQPSRGGHRKAWPHVSIRLLNERRTTL